MNPLGKPAFLGALALATAGCESTPITSERVITLISEAAYTGNETSLEDSAQKTPIDWSQINPELLVQINESGLYFDNHYWSFNVKYLDGLQASSRVRTVIAMSKNASISTLEHELVEALFLRLYTADEDLTPEQKNQRRPYFEVMGDHHSINSNDPNVVRATVTRIIKAIDDDELWYYERSHEAMRRAMNRMQIAGGGGSKAIKNKFEGLVTLRNSDWEQLITLAREEFEIAANESIAFLETQN